MSIIAWIVLGLIVGWIASRAMGAGGYGVLGDVVVGILGAVIGGWLGTVLFGVSVTGLDLTSIVLAVVGAVIVIALYRALVAPRRPAA